MAKILILGEGAKTDFQIMKHLLKVYGIDNNHEIVSYNTNIYKLYKEMFINTDNDPSSIDLLQLLKEHEKDLTKKAIFDERYSDILLIFDLDPQANNYSPEKIKTMLEYFTESSDMGKLYINYPMVEAYYHLKDIPDNEYLTRMVQVLKGNEYKKLVNLENQTHDYNKFAKSKEECNIIIKQNIQKAWYILNKSPINVPPLDLDILNLQLKSIKDTNNLYVLCTCVFYIVDYNSSLIE